MTEVPRKFWGWGLESETLSEAEAGRVAGRTGSITRLEPGPYRAPPCIEEVRLPAPRIAPPDALASRCRSDAYNRASHTYGKSYPDYVRAWRRDFRPAPDVVAYPETEADIESLLDWAGDAGLAVIPFGGGSSVVGGVEPNVGDGYEGVVTIDLRHLDKVVEIDRTSRAARIQAGVLGPFLEAQLKPAGLTLRNFPQSFAYSTLGGWIATRSGGHYATLYTHIDEFVESLRVVSPAGVIETRRLPGSGAGPSPDRLLIGSEGTLGIITEAWMRLQDRPVHRVSVALRFPEFRPAVEAIREVSQAGLYPTNLRLVDAEEARLAGAGDGSFHLVVLAFESADHPLDAWMGRALECMADHGGTVNRDRPLQARDELADAWREAFIRAPYNREALISHGLMHDTFESAITWDRFEEFHAAVRECDGSCHPARYRPAGSRNLPLYPCLPGWTGSLLHLSCRSDSRSRDPTVAGDQVGCVGRPDQGGRYDYPPSCRRPRPHALVRGTAPGLVRPGPVGSEARARSRLDPESGGAVFSTGMGV